MDYRGQIDIEELLEPRPYPTMYAYLEYVGLDGFKIEEVHEILMDHEFDDWTALLHNIVKAETLAGWGVPLCIAVNLVVTARSYYHSLLTISRNDAVGIDEY